MFRKLAIGFLCISNLFVSPLLHADEFITVRKPEKNSPPTVLGWVERVHVLPEKFELEAKLSPSIALSSIHAEEIKEFEKKGEAWVRFQIEDRSGVVHTLEHQLVGSKNTVSAKGTKSKKKTIRLQVCIAKTRFEVETLLSDRKELEQEMRIGRNALVGKFVIDPAKTHSKRPECD